MGYSTSYNLTVHAGDKSIKDIYNDWEERKFIFEGFDYAIDECGNMCDRVKWYNHENDMKKLSSRYPETVFLLTGEGEDNDDIWKKYFKNGKMQSCYAKITFDEYNESELR